MTYLTRQYGSNPRWLMKALREVPHEIDGLIGSFDRRELNARPLAGEWSAAEVVTFLLESEREDLRAVQAILRRDGARIEERRAYLVPGERDVSNDRVDDVVWDFLSLRESLLMRLELTEDWERSGHHPYRGDVTLLQYLHEVNERDLDVSWQLRKLQEALALVHAPVRHR